MYSDFPGNTLGAALAKYLFRPLWTEHRIPVSFTDSLGLFLQEKVACPTFSLLPTRPHSGPSPF